jgi:hypothetical protein
MTNELLTLSISEAERHTPNAAAMFNIIKEAMTNGENSAEKLFIFLHQVSEVFNLVKKDEATKQAYQNGFYKYLLGAKSAQVHGFTVGYSERANFDYSSSNATKWSELKVKAAAAKAELDAYEEFLETLQSEIADVESGEIIKPPTKTYTTIVSISAPKLKKAA